MRAKPRKGELEKTQALRTENWELGIGGLPAPAPRLGERGMKGPFLLVPCAPEGLSSSTGPSNQAPHSAGWDFYNYSFVSKVEFKPVPPWLPYSITVTLPALKLDSPGFVSSTLASVQLCDSCKLRLKLCRP